ncbi:hypothetical protein JCM10212_001185 [Sporobolomyces blumeae]
MVNPIINTSMRQNYGTYGVETYYNLVQESYRNPHFPGLSKVLAQVMDHFVANERPESISVLDLAAGSGEATEALLKWKASRWPSTTTTVAPPVASTSSLPSPSPSPSPVASPARSPFVLPGRIPIVPRPVVRPERRSTGSTSSSTTTTATKTTLHKAAVLPDVAPTLSITAADPFTAPAYRQRTGLPCLELSFSQVAAGDLPPPPSPRQIERRGSDSPREGDTVGDPSRNRAGDDDEADDTGGDEGRQERVYDVVVVSFALHLVETPSELWALLTELSKRAKWLCVIAPHKKPDIKPTWGWRRWDPSPRWVAAEGRGNVGGVEGDGFEIVLDRVRLRLWRSEEHWEQQ